MREEVIVAIWTPYILFTWSGNGHYHPDALKALTVAQHDELIATHEQLRSRESEIELLKLLIAKMRRMQFGCKSEKLPNAEA